MSDLILSEKQLICQLYEEDNINKLLMNFNFKKPGNIFDIYIREQFKGSKELYKNNINNNNPSKIFIDKFNVYSENFKHLEYKEKCIYKKILNDENIIFLKNLEIVKKYIFKGVDGNIQIKKTAYQIFLSDELINGLNKGINFQIIINNAKHKWKSLEIKQKEKYLLLEKENNNLLDIVQNYKKINSFLIFIYHYLKKNEFSKENFPTLEKLADLFIQLPNKCKYLYEDYSNELILLKFKLFDIYEAIHGITSKTPSGALRIFLQEKAISNEINNIKEGKKLWEKLNIEEKEKYLMKCHMQFLAYKYKQMIYNKKINRFIPKKPTSPFNLFLSERKGVKIPSGYNSLNYYHHLYNNLSQIQKDKYINLYKKKLELYNNKLNFLNNKILDLPKKPKSSLVYYMTERLKTFNVGSNNLDIDEYIKKIIEEWFTNKIEKQVYIELAKKDKLRFASEVKEFETFGYYSKKNLVSDNLP